MGRSAGLGAHAAQVVVALSLVGCGFGGRAGLGLSANTAGSVGGEVFVGGHFGAMVSDRPATVEEGLEIETSARSKPGRLGFGFDDRLDYRREPEDAHGVGWMLGLYAGVRGLFLRGTTGEAREGIAFNLLPTILQDSTSWTHIGVELQAGLLHPFNGPPDARLAGEFAARVFYEYTTLFVPGATH